MICVVVMIICYILYLLFFLQEDENDENGLMMCELFPRKGLAILNISMYFNACQICQSGPLPPCRQVVAERQLTLKMESSDETSLRDR